MSAHPLVDIALERHHHFLGAEGVRMFHACQLERPVELAVLLRHGVDVVKRVVAAPKLQRLADLDAQDARHVTAAFLVEDDRR